MKNRPCYDIPMLEQLVQGLCDLVYPRHCLMCKNRLGSHNELSLLCSWCSSTLKRNIPPFCPKCSRHMQHNPQLPLCKECQETKPYFDLAWGVLLYNESLRKLIHLFKYGNKTSLRHIFGQQIFSFLDSYRIDLSSYQWIVPIPLHSTRQRERSYNQTALLADLVAKKFGISLSTNNLVRIRNTRNQSALSQKERWTNIKGAFKINYPSQFQKKSVLIIDDLMTTGATVSEAAHLLKKAGAQRADVLTLAIAE